MNTYFQWNLINNDAPSIYFAGQAGFIFKTKKGTLLGVDLYLSDCVERFDGKDMKRLSPKVVTPQELNLDYIIASHWHLDHFDIDSMPFIMANHRTKLIAAKDCEEHVKQLQLDEERVQYISTGDTVVCDDYIVKAVFCDHGSGAPLAVGLVLEFDGIKVYIAGDTCLRLDKAEEIAKYGPFDVAIMPINGAYGNLNEREAVELTAFHKPKLMIPCHYWTFAGHHGDPGVLQENMKNKLPDQEYTLMAPGEWIYIQ